MNTKAAAMQSRCFLESKLQDNYIILVPVLPVPDMAIRTEGLYRCQFSPQSRPTITATLKELELALVSTNLFLCCSPVGGTESSI